MDYYINCKAQCDLSKCEHKHTATHKDHVNNTSMYNVYVGYNKHNNNNNNNKPKLMLSDAEITSHYFFSRQKFHFEIAHGCLAQSITI